MTASPDPEPEMDIDELIPPTAARTLTAAHRARLRTWFAEIDNRYPSPTDADLRSAARTVCLEHLLGGPPLTARGHTLTAARRAERTASAEAQQAALLAVGDGMGESRAARESGLTRPTVRRVLGKQT